jgi:hypothetical protein
MNEQKTKQKFLFWGSSSSTLWEKEVTSIVGFASGILFFVLFYLVNYGNGAHSPFFLCRSCFFFLSR